jgi:hypothetical protein
MPRPAAVQHTLAAPRGVARLDLDDARESLAYWEDRARRLPLHAIRRRREAVEMAARWRERVAEAEREHYGRGLLGAALLLAAERRLPQRTRHGAEVALRRTRQAVLLLVAAVAVLLITGAVAAVELIAEILRAVL